MAFKWLYNGVIYNTRKDFKDKFGWSTCKIDAKIKDGKITKIQTEETTYENVHNNRQ